MKYKDEGIIGKIEFKIYVKCANCMDEDDLILKASEDFILVDGSFNDDNVYVCDYCQK